MNPEKPKFRFVADLVELRHSIARYFFPDL